MLEYDTKYKTALFYKYVKNIHKIFLIYIYSFVLAIEITLIMNNMPYLYSILLPNDGLPVLRFCI